jgi:hypothetical protein
MAQKSYQLETKLGSVKVHTSSSTEVVVTFDDLLVNQIFRSGDIRLKLENGRWDLQKSNGNPSGYNSLHIKAIWDGKKSVPASDAARQKVRTVLTAAVQELFNKQPELLKVADQDRLAEIIKRTEDQVADLRRKLREAEGTLEHLQRLSTQNFQPEDLDNTLRVMGY